jgi:hypothetical protein
MSGGLKLRRTVPDEFQSKQKFFNFPQDRDDNLKSGARFWGAGRALYRVASDARPRS